MTPHRPALRARRVASARTAREVGAPPVPNPGERTTGAGTPGTVRRGRGQGMAVLMAALAAAGIAGCSASDDQPSGSASGAAGAPRTSPPASSEPTGKRGIRVLTTGLEAPWGIAFLPGGEALVTERDSARILRVPAAGGAATEVQRLSEVDGGGEGGLLGIALSPMYARDGLVYVYYTTAEDNRIARMRLGDRPEPIVTGIPRSGVHNGGRLLFGPDGYLYAGTGDASDSGRSQDVGSLGGKILRMTPDGRPAPGNPFGDSLVFSTGHRNVQGLAFDSAGRLWASEFGQNRFDEVNRIEAGRDYGWPTVEGPSDDPRFVQPLVTWDTSDASPSGVAIVGNTLYVAALRGERLWQVPLDGRGGVGAPQATLVGEYGRLRAVVQAPDGALWLLTSNRDGRGDPTADDDRILRLTV